MGQKINPRSLRQQIWNQSNWAYYTNPQNASVAWTHCLKNVIILQKPLSIWKRYRAVKAPSRLQRKKPALWHLNHWLRLLPYGQWYHNYVYKWGANVWQRQLSPLKMRYRKARSQSKTRFRNRRSFFFFFNQIGKMAEWLNALVWKTGFF